MSAPERDAEVTIFRPQRLLFWCTVFAAVIVVSSLGVWIGLGQTVRAMFTALQIGTLVVFIAFSCGLIMSLGLCVVRATPAGLWWRNGIRTHHLSWGDIRAIRYRPGDPWVYAFTDGADGDQERLQLMGIQSTDGPAAVQKAEQLKTLWRRYAQAGPETLDSDGAAGVS